MVYEVSTKILSLVSQLAMYKNYMYVAMCMAMHMVGLCDNENCYITIMQLIIMIITITVLHNIHLGMALRYAMLE